MDKYILALDQGTTSSRAILFDHDGRIVAAAQQELPQILPSPGLVEHDAEAIWSSQLDVARRAMAQASISAGQLAALGVTNQRETTILWDRQTGRPVDHAVVWQSRASAGICDRLKAEGLEPTFRAKTGLLLDAYFSGTAKNTYGTGCFLLLNTGETPIPSEHRLLTTIGWGIGGRITYCLEGSIFIGGAVVQWLRDGLGILRSSADVEALAASVPDTGGVYFVPAFVGLGAPYWDPYARGSIFGITRGTTAAHLARAALESMAYQTRDVLDAMQKDACLRLTELKVDGGASVNRLLMEFQAGVLGVPVRKPVVAETTALGAAYLAGLAVGYWQDTADLARHWALDREYFPTLDASRRDALYARWRKAVERSLGWE